MHANNHLVTGEYMYPSIKWSDFECSHWVWTFLSRSVFCLPHCLSPWETAPLCRRWPFCGSRWHRWAVTSHPLPSAACLLPPLTLSPSPCLPHSLFHSPCVLSVVFGNGVIIGQPESHFLLWAVCLLSHCLSLCSPLSLSILLLVSCPWQLYVTFIPKTCCPLQTLPTIPCMAAT